MRIQNKVFLVTGAGGGIGKEMVKTLLDKGAKIIAVDLREDSLNELKKELNTDNLEIQTLDITDRKAVEALAGKFGDIDGLINNAGIIQPFVKVNNLDYEAIERVMKVNFYGMLYMTKSFLPHLLKRPEAYIVNVSSMGGFLPVPGQSIYGASKAAVKLFTEGLYAELSNTDVHVTVVFPGATETNITGNSGVKIPTTGNSPKVPMLSPQKAAAIIIKGIECNKPIVFTGSDSKMMNLLYRLNPVFATSFIAKKMKSLLSD